MGRRISRSHAVAVLGTALLGLGAVGPLTHVALVGTLRAWDLWPGGALVIAGLAVLALALLRGGRGGWTWVPALLAPAAALYIVGLVQPVTAVPDAALASNGVGMRRAAISLLTGDFAVGWGMVALLCGAVVLCTTAGWAAFGRRPPR